MEAGVDSNNIISLIGHSDEKIFNQIYKAVTEKQMINMYEKRKEYEENHSNFKSQVSDGKGL